MWVFLLFVPLQILLSILTKVLRHKKKEKKGQERNSEKRKLKIFIFKMMEGVGRTILRF